MGLPVGSGLATQVVAKDEATYGVAPALTSGVDSFEIESETLELKKTAVVGPGLAGGKVFERTKRRVVTNYAVTGDIKLQVPTRNLGFWLRHMIGDFTQTPTQIASSGIYKTIFQPRSGMQGHSICLQKGVSTADNATVEPFTYVGLKIASWQLSIGTGTIADLTLNFDGRNELAGSGNGDPLNGSVPGLAAFAPSMGGVQGLQLFHFREATLFSGGTPTLASSGTAITGFAPAVPLTTVPVVNTSGSTAAVVITGGTVTTILINGTSAGTGDGTYFVPAGATIAVTYSAAPTWTWNYANLSLTSPTALGNVSKADIQQSFSWDTNRQFLNNTGYKSEQIENGYRKLSGSFTIEWLSSESIYNAYANDTTLSLELTFTGPTVAGQNYLLDIILPSIKLDGESPKVPGPAVITQNANFTAFDDEATVPIQVTYQSEDVTF